MGRSSTGFHALYTFDQKQFSSEIRYAGEIGDRISYTTGFYYFDQEFDYNEPRDIFGGAVQVRTRSLLDNSSWALFGEADFRIVDSLTATAGVRYTDETKKSPKFTIWRLCIRFFDMPSYARTILFREQRISKIWVGRMIFRKIISYTHRIPRAFGVEAFRSEERRLVDPYDAETVNAYEIGLKSDVIEDRLRVNTSVYFNDFKDLQRTVVVNDPNFGIIQTVQNAAAAEILAFEAEIKRVGKPMPFN